MYRGLIIFILNKGRSGGRKEGERKETEKEKLGESDKREHI